MAVQQSLSLTQLSQDVAANTSQVRILWKSTQTGQSYNLNERTATWWLDTGAGESEYTVPYQLHKAATDIILDTTVTVAHDAYGKGAVTVRTWMDTRISAGEVELTQSLTLKDIPRASTVTAANGTVGGQASVVIGAATDAYTHSLAYRFGTLSGWVSATGALTDTEEIFGGRSVSMVLPTSFYGELPDSPEGLCTLTCTTYHGETVIGTASGSFTVTADPALCAPAVTGRVVDCNKATLALTGDETVLVRGMSTARCTATATVGPGATVKELRVGTAVMEGGSLELSAVRSGSFSFKVTDSRGYTGTCQVTLPLVAYVGLTLHPTVSRTDPTSGKARLTVMGNFYNGSFGAADNTLSLTYSVNGAEAVRMTPDAAGHTYSAAVDLTGLDYGESHTVTVTASDALTTVTQHLILQPGTPVFDWGRKDFRFNVPVTVPSLTLKGSRVDDVVIAQQFSEPWYWRKWASGWAECYAIVSYITEALTVPWGSLYGSNTLSPRLEYPISFWYQPVETVTVRPSWPPSLTRVEDYNTLTQTGVYSFVSADPVYMEQFVSIEYHVAGFWKDPTEGEEQ